MDNNKFKDSISSISPKRTSSQRRGIIEDFLPYKDEALPKDNIAKKVAKIGPWVALGLFFLFAFLFQERVRWIFCSAAVIFGGGVFVKPYIVGEFLEERGRDPSVIIALASLKSIAIVFALGLIGIYMSISLGAVETPRWKSEVKIAQVNWEVEHPGEPYPKEEYFGFTIGETTFDEAMQILYDAEASFDIIEYVKGENIRVIKTNSYGNDFSTPFETMFLHFDDEQKVYAIYASLTNHLTKEKIIDISKAFKYKYDKEGSGSSNLDPGKCQEYYTPNGICVCFTPYLNKKEARIEYTNLPKQEAVEKLREEARKRKAELTASEIFASES